MVLKVGDIIEGKVNGVSNFGCFVDLEGDESGLVHISELSNEFVENVSDFVMVGDLVKSKVISNEGLGRTTGTEIYREGPRGFCL